MFDLNQYYNSRCPISLGTHWDKNFMTVITAFDEAPRSLRISPQTLRLFNAGNCGGALLETDGYIINPVEPNSLTFTIDTIVAEINGIYVEKSDVLGLQENALAGLAENGGMVSLCHPDAVHKKLEFAGLTENRLKKSESEPGLSIKDAILNQNTIKKRECILDTALRFGKLLKLRSSFEAASRNELIDSGVTSDILQTWSVKRIFKLKKKLDLLVGYLFIDVVEDDVDKIRPDLHDKLFAIQNQLHHLFEVLTILTKECKNQLSLLTCKACKLNETYVSTLRWLLQRNILPEITITVPDTAKLVWDFQLLTQKYDQRRRKVTKHSSEFIGQVVHGQDRSHGQVLMIDLIAQNVTAAARSEWNYHRSWFFLV